MIATAKVQDEAGKSPHIGNRNLAESERLRWRVLEAVGEARKLVPVKAGRFAAALGHSESHESRIRSGERASATGIAALAVYEAAECEASPLERAGFCSALIEVTLRAIAMWPELERLSTDQLHAELKKEIVRSETRANGICNNLEAPYLADGTLDLEAMLEAHTQQATASTRIAAILQVLANREK